MSELANKSEEQNEAEAEVERFRKDLDPFVVAAETRPPINARRSRKKSRRPLFSSPRPVAWATSPARFCRSSAAIQAD